MYASNHKDKLAPNLGLFFPQTTNNTWVCGELSLGGNNPDNTNTLHLQQSLLYQYLGSVAVCKSPADRHGLLDRVFQGPCAEEQRERLALSGVSALAPIPLVIWDLPLFEARSWPRISKGDPNILRIAFGEIPLMCSQDPTALRVMSSAICGLLGRRAPKWVPSRG
jgi:hypothetical protein